MEDRWTALRRLMLRAIQFGLPPEFVFDIPLSEVESLAKDLNILSNRTRVEDTWVCFVGSQGDHKSVKKFVRAFDVGASEKVANPRRMQAEMRRPADTRIARFGGRKAPKTRKR